MVVKLKQWVDDENHHDLLFDVRYMSTLNEIKFWEYWNNVVAPKWKSSYSSWYTYFVENWLCPTWLCTWTFWSKQNLPPHILQTVRTNLMTEQQWKYLKYTFLGGKVNRRYSLLFYCFLIILISFIIQLELIP